MTMRAARPRRGRVLLGALAAVALIGAACGSHADGPTSDRTTILGPDGERLVETGGRLVVSVPSESNGWNPFIDQWSDSGTMVGSSMIEALAIQAKDGTAEPWLAERWQPNEDFTQWDLFIRPGVRFHDGTPLDAAAAKKSIDAAYQQGLYQVALGPLYKRVDVIGPMTVRVHLALKWAQYPTALANLWIMAPAMLDKPDGGVLEPIGTGPFKFKSWKQGRSLTASRFEGYWRKDAEGRQLPHLSEIEFRPIPDAELREVALQTGEIDVALSTTTKIVESLKNEFNVLKDYDGQRTFLMLNTAVGEANKGNPFVNVHARRALAHATDRRRMADIVGKDVQATPFGFRPDSPWAPQGGDGYFPYDLAKARAEIDKYKADTGAPGLAFTMIGLTEPDVQSQMLDLKAMWHQAGITANIVTVESSKLIVLSAMGQYHAAWFRLFDFPDPDQMNFYMTSSNVHEVGALSLNFTHYSSKRLDSNLKVLRESLDFDQRKAASDDVIRETNDQVVNLWLYDTPSSLIVRPTVHGLDGFLSHGFSNNLPKPWLAEAWLER
jgi:peptide/nickel transport system substrate-binding protein